MSVYELHEIPLSKILEQVKDMDAQGYDLLAFLSKFLISDSGARLRKD